MKQLLALITGLVVGLFLISLLVFWLWNAVVPAILPACSEITYWQAMGLMFLCHLLFGDSVSINSKK